MYFCLHAQSIKMCTHLRQCDTPKFLSQMKSDFEETWYNRYQGFTKKIVICAGTYKQCTYTCMHVSIFSNSFLTVQNLGVMKKIKVSLEGPMYTHTILCVCMCGRWPEKLRELSCLLPYLRLPMYIRSEK